MVRTATFTAMIDLLPTFPFSIILMLAGTYDVTMAMKINGAIFFVPVFSMCIENQFKVGGTWTCNLHP